GVNARPAKPAACTGLRPVRYPGPGYCPAPQAGVGWWRRAAGLSREEHNQFVPVPAERLAIVLGHTVGGVVADAISPGPEEDTAGSEVGEEVGGGHTSPQ